MTAESKKRNQKKKQNTNMRALIQTTTHSYIHALV